jgi:hypothetical protein
MGYQFQKRTIMSLMIPAHNGIKNGRGYILYKNGYVHQYVSTDQWDITCDAKLYNWLKDRECIQDKDWNWYSDVVAFKELDIELMTEFKLTWL